MGENDLGKTVIERLTRLETKMDMILMQCPRCQAEVAQHGLAIAAHEEKFKGINRTAMAVAGVISIIIQGIGFILGAVKWH